MGLSFSHLFLVLVVVLIVFGAGRLPDVMRDIARGYKAFREGMSDVDDDSETKTRKKTSKVKKK